MKKSTFPKTLSGHRELTLDRLNFAQSGQLQVEGLFPTAEQVVVADITTTPPSTQYKTLTPSMVGIQDLTAGTNITYSAGTTYNGSTAITINSTDTDTTYTATQPIRIVGTDIQLQYDGDTIFLDGADIAVAKVPNALTFTGYATGTFDGSSALSINLVDTDTTYSAGTNIAIDGSNKISLKSAITGMTDITYSSGFFNTTLKGNDYPTKQTTATYLDLSSTTNIILPPNCFYNGSEYQLAFNQGIFMPNDDQSYYNIAVEDDFSTYTNGRVKPMTSALELVGFITIPNGWRATKGLLSLVNSSGVNVSKTTVYQNIRTWGGTGFTTLSFGNTNSETTFGTTMDGAVDRVLMLKVYTTVTTDFVGGGYITIIKI